MTALAEFLSLVREAFPKEPVPHRFFWAERSEPNIGDIPEELKSRLERRRWTEVSLMDWRMIGSSPSVTQLYLEPSAFLYYLPSLLVGVFNDPQYLVEYGIEAILPANQWHKPRGKWWHTFKECVSEKQRLTLCEFLEIIRSTRWETIGLRGQAALADAESIWKSS